MAEFYTKRQAYVASLNRAKYVVENYQGTPSVPRAIEIMVEMYLRLGLNELADSSLEILRNNYPDNPSLNKDGDFIVSNQITDPSFLYTASFGLLGSNKKDTPLTPVNRPSDTDTNQNVTRASQKKKRSFLNIITLGVLGK